MYVYMCMKVELKLRRKKMKHTKQYLNFINNFYPF